MPTFTINKPVSALFFIFLLLTPPPSLALPFPPSFSQYSAAIYRFHSLATSVADVRASRGDFEGSARAQTIAGTIQSVQGLLFWKFSWSLCRDYVKNYAWHAVTTTSFASLASVISDLNESRRSLNERVAWVSGNYKLLDRLQQSGLLREIIETIQKEVMEGDFFRDCLEVGTNGLIKLDHPSPPTTKLGFKYYNIFISTITTAAAAGAGAGAAEAVSTPRPSAAIPTFTINKPVSVLFFVFLLLTPPPSLALPFPLSFSQYHAALYLSHSLATRVADVRTSRGDFEGSARAQTIARKIQSVQGLLFWKFSWSLCRDSVKNYAWHAVTTTSFASLASVISDLDESRRSLNERVAWVSGNYKLLDRLQQSGLLREIMETIQKEVIEGDFFRDCLEVGTNDLNGLIKVLKDISLPYSASASSGTEL